MPNTTPGLQAAAPKTTGKGHGWTRSRVCSLRNHRQIVPYREGERATRGEVTLEEAAKILDVSEATVRRLIQEKVVPAPHPRLPHRFPTHGEARRHQALDLRPHP